MKIFLLTPIYVSTTNKAAATPVVHYFAREWAKQGHDVTVFHLDAKYPYLFYLLSKFFKHHIISLFNFSIPIESPRNYHEVIDNVDVYGITYTKYIPHSRIGSCQKNRIIDYISNVVYLKGIPDIFLGHWELPQLDILPILKHNFKRPTSLVFHSNIFVLEKKFGKDLDVLLKQIDYIGFRNKTAFKNFSQKYFLPKHAFIAHSGVSEEFLTAGDSFTPDFSKGVSKFVFVGLLINRKYPVEVLLALEHAFINDYFEMTYIGDGICRGDLLDMHKKYNKHGNLTLTGRLKRSEVVNKLRNSQVFIMISKHEIFGLVYLEAMALGLIPIGSRGEGIDGIIKDGENGFLCEAGNVNELESILYRLKCMSEDSLKLLSENAKRTAAEYSDYNVAKKYLDHFTI